jgi:hypothetical protein
MFEGFSLAYVDVPAGTVGCALWRLRLAVLLPHGHPERTRLALGPPPALRPQQAPHHGEEFLCERIDTNLQKLSGNIRDATVSKEHASQFRHSPGRRSGDIRQLGMAGPSGRYRSGRT